METTNSTEFKLKEVKVIPWNSYFFPEAKYVGWVEDAWGKNGRLLMSLGRTEEEAIELSNNKQGGTGNWRLMEHIKANG